MAASSSSSGTVPEALPGHDAEHPLGEYLTNLEGKSGVYFISPVFDPDEKDDRVLVKVGMSQHQVRMSPSKRDPRNLVQESYGGLGRRLDSYLLCYPAGYYIYAVLQTRALMHGTNKSMPWELEKWFQGYFTSKNQKTEFPHSRTEEWYNLTRREVLGTIAGYFRAVEDGAIPNYVTKSEIYEEPLFLNTNGRTSNRPVQPWDQAYKLRVQASFGTPSNVMDTARKRKQRKVKVEHLDPPPRFVLSKPNTA